MPHGSQEGEREAFDLPKYTPSLTYFSKGFYLLNFLLLPIISSH